MHFYRWAGMTFPPLHTTALLHRLKLHLHLPDPLVAVIQRKADQMDWHWLKGSLFVVFPDLRLVALSVIIIKLFYGLKDGVAYQKPDGWDLPDLQTWLGAAERDWLRLQKERMLVPCYATYVHFMICLSSIRL